MNRATYRERGPTGPGYYHRHRIIHHSPQYRASTYRPNYGRNVVHNYQTSHSHIHRRLFADCYRPKITTPAEVKVETKVEKSAEMKTEIKEQQERQRCPVRQNREISGQLLGNYVPKVQPHEHINPRIKYTTQNAKDEDIVVELRWKIQAEDAEEANVKKIKQDMEQKQKERKYWVAKLASMEVQKALTGNENNLKKLDDLLDDQRKEELQQRAWFQW